MVRIISVSEEPGFFFFLLRYKVFCTFLDLNLVYQIKKSNNTGTSSTGMCGDVM